MIRIDAIWRFTEPIDMRAGPETALARVVAVFGAAKPHCAYLFANRRANRMKVLVSALPELCNRPDQENLIHHHHRSMRHEFQGVSEFC